MLYSCRLIPDWLIVVQGVACSRIGLHRSPADHAHHTVPKNAQPLTWNQT